MPTSLRRLFRPIAAVTALCTVTLGLTALAAPATASTAPTIRVVGNQLVDAQGNPTRMLGMNKSGTEFACAQGWGFMDGPSDNGQISLFKSWGANTIRVPLNQSCWLGTGGVSTQYGGANYRAFITDWVNRLNANGLVAVLDLHWNAPNGALALSQQDMADRQQSPQFWTSVATHFKSNPSVVFDLYNEPHDISWTVWRDGGTTRGGWAAAGYQELINAVRATGAQQPVIINGMNWAGDLSQWLQYRPHDPLGQIIAGAHIYDFSQFKTVADWDRTIAPVARQVPVYMGEFGDHTCGTTFNRTLMDWMDTNGLSYTAWTWNTWDCGSGPAIISSHDGTPTVSGAVVRDRLRYWASVMSSPTSSPSPSPTTTTTSPSPSPTTTTTSPSPSPTTTTTSPSPSPTTTTSSPTPTSAPASTLVYGFENGISPWIAETSGAKVTSTTLARTGSQALAAQRSMKKGTSTLLRINNAGTRLPVSGGSNLSAWVRLDAGTKGTWRAALEVQDSGWVWSQGTPVTLVAGQWVKVTVSPSASVWETHRGLGLQVQGTAQSTSTLTVRMDDVVQSQ
jgi:endoglucanase